MYAIMNKPLHSWIMRIVVTCCYFLNLHGLDYHGSHFMLTFIENRILVEDPLMHIYMISHSLEDVQYTVSAPAMFETLGEGVIPALSTRRVVLRVQRQLVDIDSDAPSYKGIEIETSADIIVQAANVNELSTDSFLVLPIKALGTDYFVMSYIYTGIKQHGYTQGPSEFGIVSTSMDRIKVTFTFPRPGMMQHVMTSRNSFTPTDTTFWIILEEKGSTYLLQSTTDLTGVHISSTHPIGVVCGTTWTSIGTEYMGDHLAEMMPPTTAWGGHFFTQPLANRSAGDVFRVLAKENDTFVRIQSASTDTPTIIELHKGEYHDFEDSAPTHIIANKGILLAQFCKSFGADGNRDSDPFFVLVPPVEQFASSFEFTTHVSLHLDFTQNYISIIMPAHAVEYLLLDDKPVQDDQLYRKWKVLDGTDYSAATVIIQNGRHHMTSTVEKIPVGGIFYGFKFQESYGMALNHKLDRIRYVCTTTAMYFADFFDNDCDGHIDEEIANGIDDDGDGLIDEDIYSNTSSRYEYAETSPVAGTETSHTQFSASTITSTNIPDLSTLISKTTTQPNIKITTESVSTMDSSTEPKSVETTLDTTMATTNQGSHSTTLDLSTGVTLGLTAVQSHLTSTIAQVSTSGQSTSEASTQKLTSTTTATASSSTLPSTFTTTQDGTTASASTLYTFLSSVYPQSTQSTHTTTPETPTKSPELSTLSENQQSTTTAYSTEPNAKTTSVPTSNTFIISTTKSPASTFFSTTHSSLPTTSAPAHSTNARSFTTSSSSVPTITSDVPTTMSSKVSTHTTGRYLSTEESTLHHQTTESISTLPITTSPPSTSPSSTSPPTTTPEKSTTSSTHQTSDLPDFSTSHTTHHRSRKTTHHATKPTTTSSQTDWHTTTSSSVVTGTERSRTTDLIQSSTSTEEHFSTDGNFTRNSTTETFDIDEETTPATEPAQKATSTWDRYKVAILIPVLIVTGVPLLCLLCLFIKALIGSKVKKKKEKPPQKPKPRKKSRAVVTPTFDARAQMATDYGDIGWSKLDKMH